MTEEMKTIDVSQKRMLSLKEAQAYTGLGMTYLVRWTREVGAFKKIGRRSLIDKTILDKALEQLEPVKA